MVLRLSGSLRITITVGRGHVREWPKSSMTDVCYQHGD